MNHQDTQPTISVIIPSYKPKDYLWKCLESIEQQTLSSHCYEVIVVLNGCNQPYLDNIKQHIAQRGYDNVRLLQTDTAGVSNARNMALKHAKGTYVCFIDDDDWVSAEYLEALLAKAEEASIVVSDVKKMHEETLQEFCKHFLGRAYSQYNEADESSLYKNRSFFSSACCKLIPRNCIGDAAFDTRIKQGEDSLFMYNISWTIKKVKRADQRCIYYVRCRQGSGGRRKEPFLIRFKDCNLQICLFTKYYFKHFRHNGFCFYASRVIATFLRKIVRETIKKSL